MSRRTNSDIIVTRSGFTLVELMISIAVMTLLAAMAAQTFRAVLVAREMTISKMEVNETGRSALDFIASELRSSYLTPDSVKPVTTGPRFRFAGIHRDLDTEDYPDIPGAGVDDDGDGYIDEEVLDGVDGDYPNGAKTSINNARPRPDPLGCDDAGDRSCVDEDIGLIPSDILHFVSAVESSGSLILQEISYGLDPSGTKLIRRAQVLDVSGNLSGTQLQKMLDFGQFIDNTTMERLLPPVPQPGTTINTMLVKKAMDKEGPAFINVLAPCHRGWRYPMEEGINISKMAVDTCVWPLFEVDEGSWRLSYNPRAKPPVADWLKRQRRFDHLFKTDDPTPLEAIQRTVDEDWARLLERCGEAPKSD